MKPLWCLVCIFLLSVSSSYAQENCIQTLDLVFVVDGSNSVGPANFGNIRRALLNSIAKFEVKPEQTRVGVVTYGDEIYEIIPLTDDVNSLNASVSNLEWPDGGTATYLGLQEADSMLLQDSRSVLGIPQVVVLLADGDSDNRPLTFQVAQRLKNRGVTVLAVGVGSLISMEELQTIASRPDYVYLEASFDGLDARLQNLTSVVCESACSKEGLDAMFLLDGSNSVKRRNFETALAAINQTVLTFWKNYTTSRVGFIAYGSSVSQVIPLTSDMDTFISSIGATEFPDTGTGTDLALTAAIAELQKAPREDVPRVIVLVTDGESDNLNMTVQAANAAKAVGIVIFAVGVGADINREELNTISSNRRLSFTVDNFAVLEEQLNVLIDSVCDGPPTTTTTTTTTPSQSFMCPEKVELLFVIDGSDETGQLNFETLKTAVISAAIFLAPAPNKTNVGAVAYSSSVSGFGPVSDINQFVAGMASLSYPGGPRTTSQGMRQSAQFLINSQRSDAPSVMVVVTTGTSDDPFRVATDSFFVRQIGIQTFALGVTNATQFNELAAIADSRADRFAVAETYDEVPQRLFELMRIVCDLARDFPNTPTPVTVSPTTSARPTSPVSLTTSATTSATSLISSTTSARTSSTSLTSATTSATTSPTSLTSPTSPTPRDVSPTTATSVTTALTSAKPPSVTDHCSTAKLVAGIGYRWDPDDCTRFIQCYYTPDNSSLAVHRSCPLGQFWDQAYLRCDEACNVECPEDPCRVLPNLHRRPMNGSCRGYWVCMQGASNPRCCPPGSRFEASAGCVPDMDCREFCGPQDECGYGYEFKGVCDKKPDWNDPMRYSTLTDQGDWAEASCTPGQFNITLCACAQSGPDNT